MFKKDTFKLVVVASVALFLPYILFAQCAVVGYAFGQDYVGIEYTTTTFPSSLQLDRLTHVIASDIGCKDDGRLFTGRLPDFWEGAPPSNYIWNGSKNEWLASLINRAHAKGVNASISVGGDYFLQATNSTNINTFVSHIVNFVNVHGFDGVNINWEYPGDSLEWSQCIALLEALKDTLPVKRITIALSHATWVYADYQTVPQQILSIADGIYLMTYDEGDWPNHSDVAQSIYAINNWITWGTPTCAQKKKLFLGSAFYGWTPHVGLENGGIRVSYRDHINGTSWTHRGDLPADVRNKAIHTRDNGFGGVFIWELGYDLPANDSQSLLKAIDDVRPSLSGPSIVCNTWVNYTVDSIPQGATVSWDKSENLIRSDKMGPFSFQVRAASPAANGPGWVKAIISGSCDTVSLIKHVWVGTPPGNIAGPYVWQYGQELQVHCLEPGQWATMRLINTHPDVTDYSWTLFDESEYPIMLGNGPISMPFTISGNYPPRYVEVSYGIDGCSWSTNQKYVSLCGGVLRLVVHPNPASHIITISEADAEMNDYTPWILRLTSSQGIVLMNNSATLPETINIGGFQPGFYILYAQKGQYSEQHVVVVK